MGCSDEDDFDSLGFFSSFCFLGSLGGLGAFGAFGGLGSFGALGALAGFDGFDGFSAEGLSAGTGVVAFLVDVADFDRGRAAGFDGLDFLSFLDGGESDDQKKAILDGELVVLVMCASSAARC